MTLGEAAGLALKVHGAVWLAAAAAYYKYGDRTNLFEKSLQGNRSARQSILDTVASDLSKQLQPVVRDATGARSHRTGRGWRIYRARHRRHRERTILPSYS